MTPLRIGPALPGDPPARAIVPDRPIGEPAPAVRSTKTARAQARQQMRQVAQLRAATMILAVLAVIGAPVAFFVIKEATRDPIFAELDRWTVPDWAAGKHVDEAYGSRWCIGECRFRERTWESTRVPGDTHQAYVEALKAAGWVPWQINGCAAEGVDGFQTCWQRDEYVLNLWVRPAVCEIKPARPEITPNPGAPAPGPPAGGAQPNGAQPNGAGQPDTAAEAAAAGCPAAMATVKVFNRIAYQQAGAGAG